MAIVAPQGRQPLSADALLRLVRTGFANLPDQRGGEAERSCTDVLMSACAMCALTSPALLAFDKPRAEGHVRTIDGIERVPCDTPRRERLDPVSPESLHPLFTRVFRQLQRGQALEPRVCLDDHDWLSLDGTGYFAATMMHGASCLHKTPRHGRVTYAHQRWGAAMVHPDVREVIPLMPEPLVTQDGTDNHDGERHAAKRFMTKWRQDHPHRTCIVTEESLSANAPHLETRQAHHLHSMLGVKAGDHALLCHQVQVAEPAGRVTDDTRHARTAGLVHGVRLVNDVPLHDSQAGGRVNGMEDWERGQDKVQHCRWVTDVRVHQRHVFRLMRGGRARWKMEPETVHPLKHHGDHFEHHDGPGQQHRSVVCARLMMRAFVVDQTQQRGGAVLQTVWAKLGRQRLLWERRRALFDDEALESMRPRLAALCDGLEKPPPSVALESSSSRHRCLLRPRSIESGDPPQSGESMPHSREESAGNKISCDV